MKNFFEPDVYSHPRHKQLFVRKAEQVVMQAQKPRKDTTRNVGLPVKRDMIGSQKSLKEAEDHILNLDERRMSRLK